jgi:hypothetical protein
MQNYNPNNPVYKYKSVKTESRAPNVPHTQEHEEDTDDISKKKIPNSYGLYLQPPQFKDATMKSTTYLQYISFTIDSVDRDYTKYPNPFSFVCDRFSEYFKNIKVFQIFYTTLPQFNLVQIPIPQDANYTFMRNYILSNPTSIVNNLLIINGSTTYRICNFHNNEVNFLIDDVISVVYSFNMNSNIYYTYGVSSSYKLNLQPFLRLNIPEIIYLPITSTDNQQFTYLLRTSRAKKFICYASVRSPAKVFKEQTLLNITKLTFNFYDSFNNQLKVLYLDKYADPIDDSNNFASRFNYIRHPLFYYHQIVMSVRVGMIKTMLK